MTLLGLISDTHGHLDPRVAAAFADVDRILHAGDICGDEVLWELEALGKPVHAVLGNCDRYEMPDSTLPTRAAFEIEGVRFVLVHDRHDAGPVDRDSTDVVVFGHSHRPEVTERDGVLWVNPGSTFRARADTGRTVALLEIGESGSIVARIVALDDFGEQPARG